MKPAELQHRMAAALDAYRAGKPMHEALSAAFPDRAYKGQKSTKEDHDHGSTLPRVDALHHVD